MRQQASIDLPLIPLGQMLARTAGRSGLRNVLGAVTLSWNPKRQG